MPPNMNREQAWAWALDNFEALSRLSCQHPQCLESRYDSIVTLDGVPYGAERGQKRCRELHVKEPKAEIEERLWTPPEVGGTSSREAHWALNQPGDDSVHSNGKMPRENPGAQVAPGNCGKQMLTRERSLERKDTQVMDSIHHGILQSPPWKEPGKLR